MPNILTLKRSAVAGKIPATTDLALGELGINTYDGKVYLKKNNGTESVVEVGGSAHTHTGVYQPADADLAAIAGLAGTSGLLRKTAADTWGLDSTSYLPLGGASTANQPASTTLAAQSSGGAFQAQSLGSGATAGAACMSFHRPNAFAAYFGLDTDNQWKVGGWSYGIASYKLFHEGNLWAGELTYSFTAVKNNTYTVYTGNGAHTVTLPAAASCKPGDFIRLLNDHNTWANPTVLYVSPNGGLINEVSGVMTVDRIGFGALTFVCAWTDGATAKWVIA